MNAPRSKSEDREPLDWQSLEKSYLAGICKQVQSSRRQHTFRRIGMRFMLLLLATGIGVWGVSRVAQQGAETLPRIPCSVVQANHVAFLAGTLDADLTSQIEAHVEKCVRCQAMLAKMRSSDASHLIEQGKTVVTRPSRFSSLLLAKQ